MGLLDSLKAAPALGALGGTQLAGFAADPLGDLFSNAPEDREFGIAAEESKYQKALKLRAKHLRRLKTQNLMRLAQYRPDIYNSVAVGRQLPRNATVIGGSPREDLLEMVADMMATGGFQDQEGAL